MNKEILKIIENFSNKNISFERVAVLEQLIDYIQAKVNNKASIRLNFICTHNSRRSHLSQIWAQTMAYHFGLKDIFCYSGGTEATALYPKVAETLTFQGFQIEKIADNINSIYAIKYAENELPILGFSKKYNDFFNPKIKYGAIMTCSSADEACPIVFGAEARFPIRYDDPKIFDNTEFQTEKYIEKSIEIGQEMWYVFSQIKL